MINVVASTWNVPPEAAKALLLQQVPYSVEGETVVFAFGKEASMSHRIMPCPCGAGSKLLAERRTRHPAMSYLSQVPRREDEEVSAGRFDRFNYWADEPIEED